MIYLDTSAAVKLINNEPESRALIYWINASDGGLVSSTLLEFELVRAARWLEMPAAARTFGGELRGRAAGATR